jgi:hypothetical protein
MSKLTPEIELVLAAGFVCVGAPAPRAETIDRLRAAVDATAAVELTSLAKPIRAAAAKVVACPPAARAGWIDCLDRALSRYLRRDAISVEDAREPTTKGEAWARFAAKHSRPVDEAEVDRWRNRSDLR